MAESVLCRRTPENRSQTSSGNRFSHINAALLKKRHNYDMLCSEIENIQKIMECLLQKETIIEEEFSEVISIERRGRRVAKLLEILFTRPTGQWEETFLDILEVTGQSNVINRLKKRTPPSSPSAIRPLRNTNLMQRVLLMEEDAEDSIIRRYSVERVQAARDILDSDIVSIYKGSILFILDPSSEKAIEELWERHAGSDKIRKFLSMILKDYEFKEKFNRKRIVKVELTEEPNEFHCRVRKSSCKFLDYILDISPKDCSECFRRTVVECYQNLLDEIETKMIQKTFHGKDSIVPDFIKIAAAG
ncbi:uncharacterized protein LOC127722718 [Mytilus californianus]|uniref:uncharacterized protein LOC127722718 n=1 Tax=Mytilus californianus TaxID=6549 RepID=UPI00224865BB|nr:uncharacterized protein LOC127722718 [Mytilus californianus]